MSRIFFIIALLFPLGTFAQAIPAGAQNAFSFSGKDAQDAVAPAIIGAGGGGDVKVEILGVREDDTIITASSSIAAEVEGMDLDKPHNRWQATLMLKSGGRNLAPVKLAGRYEEMAEVPVLKHRVLAGEVITTDDIETLREPVTHLYKTALTRPEDLAGKSPKHAISAERPVRADEVGNPALINKGEHVTLLFRGGNLEIKTLGEAMESGAKGDVIRVKNITSKAVIQGTVETSDLVRVSSPEDTTAEVTP